MLVALAVFAIAALTLLRMEGASIARTADLDQRLLREVVAQNLATEWLTDPAPPALGDVNGQSTNMGRAGYYFEQRRDGAWLPLDPGRFGLVAWKDGTAASVAGGVGEGAQPGSTVTPERQRLVFDPVGLAGSEARVRLARGKDALAVSVARDGTVKLDAG